MIPSWVRKEVPKEYAKFSAPPLALIFASYIPAISKTSFCQSVFAKGSVALILESNTRPVEG